ncbi:MAG: hypothetical protein ACYS1A_16615 [Planctomycetota bacterium]|jgi:predicted RNA-binding Zn-ribbon protein involved in translation (DUF1610 family)
MSEKIDLEKEMKEQAATISSLVRKNSKLEKQIRGFKGLQARQHQEHNHDQPVNTETKPEETIKKEREPHFIGEWQKHCPTCGDTNPDFKDETQCDPNNGGCGMHLGAQDNLKNIRACPNCGHTKARLVEKKEN